MELKSKKPMGYLRSIRLLKQQFNTKKVLVIFKTAALLFLLVLQLPTQATVGDTVISTQANAVVELTFTAQLQYPDPDNQVEIDAVFTDPNGRQLRVPGFWEGNGKWVVRYSSPIVGIHRFRSECSEPRDKGLNGVAGKIIIRPRKKLSS